MTSPCHRHQKGFEREVSLMVLTSEDRVQEVTQSDQFSPHYRLQLGVHLRPVNISRRFEVIPRLRHSHRDQCLNPENVMDVGRLDTSRGNVQNRITDIPQSEVEVVMEEAVILEDVVVEVMVVTKTAGVMGKLQPLQHNMVGATGRQTIGPIFTPSLGGLKLRHQMLLSQVIF